MPRSFQDLTRNLLTNLMTNPHCVFCNIVARREPATIHYEDELVIIFDNQLDWVPVQILVVPRTHMSQAELWHSGDLLAPVGDLAVQMGEGQCPDGFRILSNFGRDGMQSQPHAHLHVIGGEFLGRYLRQGIG